MLERAHVVQAVGKLDDDDADILCHGKKHLPQIFRLDLHLLHFVVDLAEFGHPVDQKAHVLAEGLADFIHRHRCVLHDIVQYTGRDRLLVHLEIRQDNADAQRVDDIRLTGLSHLSLMGFLRHMAGLLDHGKVV